MGEYLALALVLTVLYAISAGRRFGHLSVISLFTYAQAVMATGTLGSLDTTIRADRTHAALILWTLTTVVGVGIVYSAFLGRTRKQYAPQIEYSYPRIAVWVLVAVSLAISVWYYSAVGYLAIVDSLRSVVTGTEEDIAGLRLASYAGEEYFYPGYVNQFKNALLPALTLVTVASAFHFRRASRYLLALALVPVTALLVLGTGQRAAFVLAMIMAVVFGGLVAPKRIVRFSVRAAIVAIPVFFIATFASGRAAQQLAEAQGIAEKTSVLVEQLVFRILGSNQLSSIVGFRYIEGLDTSVLGEWRVAVAGLLPGQRGSDLSNQIFAVLYGSTRGTAPLSLWGSAYYNLGFFGAVTFALFLAIVLCRVSQAVNALTRANLLHLVGIAGFTASVGTWIADGPTSILNTGVVVYVSLWVWGGYLSKRPREAASQLPRRSRVHAESPKG